MKKRLVSMLLALAMCMGLAVPAFAVSSVESQNADRTIGTILHQERTDAYSRDSDATLVTISYAVNSDNSYTIYQYRDGCIVEEHTTLPGSGVVYHKFYNADGTITANSEITKDEPSGEISPLINNDPYSNLGSGASVRPLGYMHYRNPWSNQLFSIKCYLIEERHINQTYTFYAGTGKALADWIAFIISITPFGSGPVELADKIVSVCITNGILKGPVTGILTAVTSKTVTCDYYNQEIHGDPTQPSGRGTHGRLDGTFCYLTNLSGEMLSEGFVVSQWGQNVLGRQMMYKVFQIDEAPTSWSEDT